MTRLTDDARTVLVLASRLGDRRRPSLPVGAWHRLVDLLDDGGMAPQDLFHPEVDISEVPGVDSETAGRIEVLIAGAAAVAFEFEELHRKGVAAITINDAGYPEALRRRLGRAAPPVLFSVGDPGILAAGGVAVVGSRNVDPAGAAVAKDVATAAVAAGFPVISGGARGIDQIAMNAAFVGGGRVVGVLADSLLKRIQKPDVLGALDSGMTCLVTQQHPAVGFSPAAAMARNKLVYALSDIAVVVASDEKSGGTWAGAVEAVKRDYGRVAVWRGEGEGPGNAALEAGGATPFRTVGELWGLMSQDIDPPPEQLTILS